MVGKHVWVKVVDGKDVAFDDQHLPGYDKKVYGETPYRPIPKIMEGKVIFVDEIADRLEEIPKLKEQLSTVEDAVIELGLR